MWDNNFFFNYLILNIINEKKDKNANNLGTFFNEEKHNFLCFKDFPSSDFEMLESSILVEKNIVNRKLLYEFFYYDYNWK